MSKAQQIIALKAQGLNTRQIAIEVYGEDCNVRTKMAYVRVVLNQRQGSGKSKHDTAYFKRRYENDPEFRAKLLAQWAAHGKLWKKTEAGREYNRECMRKRRVAARSATAANHISS